MFPHTAIDEGDFFIRHDKPVSRSFFLSLLGNFLGREVPAGAGIDHVAVRGMGCAGRMELRTGAETGINQPLRLEFLIARLINFAALALVIGHMRPTMTATFIPEQPQPAEVFFQQVGVFTGTPFGIKVFNAKDNLSALMLRAQPCKQAARKISEVEPSAGTGRKSPDDAAHRPSFHSPSFGWKMGVL